MDSHNDQPTNGAGSEGRPYRFSHPLRYAALAGALAAFVAGPLDLLLFGNDAGHAVKSAIANAVTWFVVLLGGLWYVRLKQDRSG